eukprot:TRINITY_DN31181_c0_g1_i1.p1 TRINITY_DN31181_c0_g1~~TRINITY_DN31181_c0_g1_i1.p1  ORF type:complete len:243 (+),score=51.47 TRINITY_DN31181_c0_g1_i1:43-771(+)
MLHRTGVCLWSVPNYKGAFVSKSWGNNAAVINRNKNLHDSSLVRGKTKGRGGDSNRSMMKLAKSFADSPSHSAVSSMSEELMLHEGDLDRVLQHLIVILQKQIDISGKGEAPQRRILAETFLSGTTREVHWARYSFLTWKDTYKLVDTGYLPGEASRINPNRDEILFRIKRHFKARRVNLTLDQFTSHPPGFSCYLSWAAEDDHLALTPEGQAVSIPRVDWVQKMRNYTRKGVGHGQSQTAI